MQIKVSSRTANLDYLLRDANDRAQIKFSNLGAAMRNGMSLEQVGRNWIAGWNSRDSEAFSRLYAPDGEYVDPSFGIRRKGRDFVRMHHEIWWKAIPDFVMKARHIRVADRSVVVEVTAEGTFSNGDLGGGKMKATQKAFHGWSIAVLDVNEVGEIVVCCEYYDRSIVPGGEQPPFDELRL